MVACFDAAPQPTECLMTHTYATCNWWTLCHHTYRLVTFCKSFSPPSLCCSAFRFSRESFKESQECHQECFLLPSLCRVSVRNASAALAFRCITATLFLSTKLMKVSWLNSCHLQNKAASGQVKGKWSAM